ncbi:MAG: transposase [Nitrososphaeria archaeon]
MPTPRAPNMTKGLKARYGSTVRKRVSKVLYARRMTRQCPSCGSANLRRVSAGIWSCKKCGYTMAGGAYEP